MNKERKKRRGWHLQVAQGGSPHCKSGKTNRGQQKSSVLAILSAIPCTFAASMGNYKYLKKNNQTKAKSTGFSWPSIPFAWRVVAKRDGKQPPPRRQKPTIPNSSSLVTTIHNAKDSSAVEDNTPSCNSKQFLAAKSIPAVTPENSVHQDSASRTQKSDGSREKDGAKNLTLCASKEREGTKLIPSTTADIIPDEQVSNPTIAMSPRKRKRRDKSASTIEPSNRKKSQKIHQDATSCTQTSATRSTTSTSTTPTCGQENGNLPFCASKKKHGKKAISPDRYVAPKTTSNDQMTASIFLRKRKRLDTSKVDTEEPTMSKTIRRETPRLGVTLRKRTERNEWKPLQKSKQKQQHQILFSSLPQIRAGGWYWLETPKTASIKKSAAKPSRATMGEDPPIDIRRSPKSKNQTPLESFSIAKKKLQDNQRTRWYWLLEADKTGKNTLIRPRPQYRIRLRSKTVPTNFKMNCMDKNQSYFQSKSQNSEKDCNKNSHYDIFDFSSDIPAGKTGHPRLRRKKAPTIFEKDHSGRKHIKNPKDRSKSGKNGIKFENDENIAVLDSHNGNTDNANSDSYISENHNEAQAQLKKTKEWEEKFNLLVEFKKKHGTLNIPKSNNTLYHWVLDQRQRRKSLSNHQRQCLDLLGFRFQAPSVKNRNISTIHGPTEICTNPQSFLTPRHLAGEEQKEEKMWIEMYRSLVAYQKEHGTHKLSKKKEHSVLTKWVRTQRESCMDQNRIDLLRAAGIKKFSHDPKWMRRYEQLVQYKKDHGNTNVPSRYKENPSLGRWVHGQRQDCKKQDRIDLLNDIGFVWRLRDPRK